MLAGQLPFDESTMIDDDDDDVVTDDRAPGAAGAPGAPGHEPELVGSAR